VHLAHAAAGGCSAYHAPGWRARAWTAGAGGVRRLPGWARGRAVGELGTCSPVADTTNAEGSRGKERSRGHHRKAQMSRGWVSIHDPDDPGTTGMEALGGVSLCARCRMQEMSQYPKGEERTDGATIVA
jgi:hypothetical protein